MSSLEILAMNAERLKIRILYAINEDNTVSMIPSLIISYKP